MNSSDSLPIKKPEPPTQFKYFLFAGRRINYIGEICLILISPHNGRHFYVEEKKLNDAFVYLGSFLRAKRTTRRVLYDFEPLDSPKKFQVEVKDDVAFLVNLEATLEDVDGVKLFHCKTLGYVFCKEDLLPGNHWITAHLMSQSVVTKNGKVIHFEGKRTAAPQKPPHQLMSKFDPDEKYADKVKIGWLNAPRGAGKEFKK